jgi:hypothetical protein
MLEVMGGVEVAGVVVIVGQRINVMLDSGLISVVM